MLELAAKRVKAGAVRFIQADLFNWQPDRRYDAIFFGFWLSHIPHERFAPFWSMIDTALHPRGQVFFIDDNLRAPDELIEGEASSIIQRRLSDGTPHRIVKVPHDPKARGAAERARVAYHGNADVRSVLLGRWAAGLTIGPGRLEVPVHPDGVEDHYRTEVATTPRTDIEGRSGTGSG